MSISLKVDGIAGTSIEDAAEDMLKISKLLGIMIEMDFNGVQLIAANRMTAEMIVDSYHNAIEDKRIDR